MMIDDDDISKCFNTQQASFRKREQNEFLCKTTQVMHTHSTSRTNNQLNLQFCICLTRLTVCTVL